MATSHHLEHEPSAGAGRATTALEVASVRWATSKEAPAIALLLERLCLERLCLERLADPEAQRASAYPAPLSRS